MRSKYEVKAQKELEAEGWRVDNKAGMARFSKNRDFWNLFDLVAVRLDKHYVRWISIKGHNRGNATHRRELQEFYLPPGNIKELWYWPDNRKKKEWVKKVIDS